MENIIRLFLYPNSFKVDKNELEIGDHIFRSGACFENSLLFHHGIYLGNNKVVEFSLPLELKIDHKNIFSKIKYESKYNIVHIISFSEFMKKYKICYKVKSDYDKNNTLKNIKKYLNTRFNGYDIINNNCEHFINWCTKNNHYSIQTKLGLHLLKKLRLLILQDIFIK